MDEGSQHFRNMEEDSQHFRRRSIYNDVIEDKCDIQSDFSTQGNVGGSMKNLRSSYLSTIPEVEQFPTEDQPQTPHLFKSLAVVFPIIPQMLNYTVPTFIADLKSAATVSFVLIPQAIAFSTLARVDPVRALVSAVFPLFIYALLGASRQLSVGPEALSSVLVGTAVADEIQRYGGDANTIATILGASVGLFAISLSIIQAGFIDNILSGYLLCGFVLGVANLIIVEQIPGMFGIKVPHAEGSSTFQTFLHTVEKLPDAHTKTAIFGVGCLMFLLAFKFAKSKFGHHHPWVVQLPDILILVLLSTAMSFLFDFKSQGIAVIGEFNNKLVPPSIPPMSFEQFQRLLPNVVVITIVGYIESQSVTRAFGLKNGYFPSGDRELFALGAANLFGSFFGTYVTFGSLPRSRIQANSGGKTTLVGAMAALIVLVLFTSLGAFLKLIPKATLSAIVMMAGINLIEFDEIGFLMGMRSIPEICMFVFSWCMTVFVPVSTGILINLGLACLLILRKTTQLYMSLLGKANFNRKDEESVYVEIREYPEARLSDGLLAISVRGPLEFYNAGRLRRRIEMLLEVETKMIRCYRKNYIPETPLTKVYQPGSRANTTFVNSCFDQTKDLTVILDFSRCDSIDTSAVFILHRVVKTFQKQEKRIIFCGLKPVFLTKIQKAGIDELLGEGNIIQKLDEINEM